MRVELTDVIYFDLQSKFLTRYDPHKYPAWSKYTYNDYNVQNMPQASTLPWFITRYNDLYMKDPQGINQLSIFV